MKKTTHKIIVAVFTASLFFFQNINAADATASQHFENAKQEIENMLATKTPLSFEHAIFLTENAYWQNQLEEKSFSQLIEFHTKNIQQLIKANTTKKETDFKATLLKSSEKQFQEYQAALANYAIFLYMTDTTFILDSGAISFHLPYVYSHQDPLGTLDFSNTQVNKLLYSEQQAGNCFALTSLFKIFSDRLNSKAIICTAPGHVYIRHADDRGIYHNVELGSKSFPGTGSISTITYSTDEAMRSDIALRELTLKQSVGLCLIYLAKGYEHKLNEKASDFALQCAELALKYDSLNLNALLLKAEVFETRLLKQNKTVAQLQADKQFQNYQKQIVHLFNLGYREMPSEQKRMVIDKLRNPNAETIARLNNLQVQSKQKSFETRTASLSWGLFDEEMRTKPTEIFGRTAFSSSNKKIATFLPLDTTADKYPIDLIVFAWCVDPLAAKYPSISPYAAFANNPIMYVDQDGREPKWGQLATLSQVMGEMQKAYTANQVYSATVSQSLSLMVKHFEGNRMFERNSDGQLVDTKGSKDVKRYVYTDQRGWIDMHHFFRLAEFTKDNGQKAAELYSYMSERYQKWDGNPSGWSYEDIASDMAGIEFWNVYGDKLKSGNIKLQDAVSEFMTSLKPKDPMDSPNCDYIPHIIDPKYTLEGAEKKGFKGETLRAKHKEIFDKRPAEMKKKISSAHDEITN
jgi:hypothetical protein